MAEAPIICLEGTEKEWKEQMFGFAPHRQGGISSAFDCLILLPGPKATMPRHCSPASPPHPSAKGCQERQAIANKDGRGTGYCEINTPTLPEILMLHVLIRVNNRPKRPQSYARCGGASMDRAPGEDESLILLCCCLQQREGN